MIAARAAARHGSRRLVLLGSAGSRLPEAMARVGHSAATDPLRRSPPAELATCASPGRIRSTKATFELANQIREKVNPGSRRTWVY